MPEKLRQNRKYLETRTATREQTIAMKINNRSMMNAFPNKLTLNKRNSHAATRTRHVAKKRTILDSKDGCVLVKYMVSSYCMNLLLNNLNTRRDRKATCRLLARYTFFVTFDLGCPDARLVRSRSI